MKRVYDGDDADCYIERLPRDILIIIINSLSLTHIIQLSTLSRYWNKECLESLGTIDYMYTPSGKYKNLFDSIGTLRKFGNVKTIRTNSILDCQNFYKSELDKIATNIQVLTLYHLSSICSGLLDKFINIVSLTLYSIQETDYLFKSLISMKHLRILSLIDPRLKQFIELGELRNLEFFSLSFKEGPTKENPSKRCLRELDQSLCYLTKLKYLRLYHVKTRYSYLTYLNELRFLDLYESSLYHEFEQDLLDEDFSSAQILGQIGNMSYLINLSIPYWINICISPNFPFLQCLFTYSIINIHNLPNLRHYHFILHEGDDLDHMVSILSKYQCKRNLDITIIIDSDDKKNSLIVAKKCRHLLKNHPITIVNTCPSSCHRNVIDYTESIVGPICDNRSDILLGECCHQFTLHYSFWGEII